MESLYLAATTIGLVCAATAIIAILILHQSRTDEGTAVASRSMSMVFHDNRLIDADDWIWSLLPGPQTQITWAEIRAALRPVFPDLPDHLGRMRRLCPETGVTLSVTRTGSQFRVTIDPEDGSDVDWFLAKHAEAHAKRMNTALMRAPDLIWYMTDLDGFVWGNDAFATYAESFGGMSHLADHISGIVAEAGSPYPRRVPIDRNELRTDQNRWLDVSMHETEAGRFYYATGIDAMMRAEAAQQNFVQTLSKTFANLTTGLAIFDRDRRLMVFNPALVDLCRVPIDFLSARPAMFEFFDKLRDCRVMPEPKSYDDWRDRMARLVAAAHDDRFRETWSLSSGQTIDVTGQPYPDGAIAFLFNDITAEVSLTRGYRTELDTLQSVIDTIDDAVAVFDPQGILTVCNANYATQWDVDPDACIPAITIADATQVWKSAFHPSPIWADLRDFVTNATDRVSWDSELRGRDGREVLCKIDPICHGSTLIRFSHRLRENQTPPDTGGLKIVSA